LLISLSPAYLSQEAIDILNIDLPSSLLNQTFSLFHGFISNFKESMITAVMHGNSLSSSLAVQYVGSKTWLFFSSRDYNSNNGFRATPNAVFAVPTKAPRQSVEAFPYTSQPGDLLFFQESWAHMVLTHAGPNILINYRKLSIGNFIRNPVKFVHTLLNRALYIDKTGIENKVKPSRIQENYMALQNELLCYEDVKSGRNGNKEGDGKVGRSFSATRLDKDLVDLITKSADGAIAGMN
jgi:hypothetical protein